MAEKWGAEKWLGCRKEDKKMGDKKIGHGEIGTSGRVRVGLSRPIGNCYGRTIFLPFRLPAISFFCPPFFCHPNQSHLRFRWHLSSIRTRVR
ncbi:hypothetical protein Enr13x_32890 [Stieleria neptunia]|uniref:Uncharacterized protein n=1 Tax=Stieleria neptunia TaxID=2527979 RepID=A0A518HRE7_9BACT|nr:hypothetical protein Enr13x_32890 [Stieleria neptunia]